MIKHHAGTYDASRRKYGLAAGTRDSAAGVLNPLPVGQRSGEIDSNKRLENQAGGARGEGKPKRCWDPTAFATQMTDLAETVGPGTVSDAMDLRMGE